MNREEIMKVLPHRDGMLLLDRVEIDGEEAKGSYAVRGDEWFLQGHFPNHPVVPGVILCEIMAQTTCGLLLERAGTIPFVVGFDKVKFRQQVRPGDIFETTCRFTKPKGRISFIKGEGRVNGKLCVEGEFSIITRVPEV